MISQIDDNFETIINKVLRKRAEIKLKLSDCLKLEEARINKELENFQQHQSLVAFCRENVAKSAMEIENYKGKQIKGSDLANRVENFKAQEEKLSSKVNQL